MKEPAGYTVMQYGDYMSDKPGIIIGAINRSASQQKDQAYLLYYVQ